MVDGFVMLLIAITLICGYCVLQAEAVRKHRPAFIAHIVTALICLTLAGIILLR
ncbi:hypothetical protein [Alkalicoccobacillus porphyridii]|uniref:hypothetical protein n=1 Tax=Alkalicoccobacillus porphyridii TaxID=2597270 RepID=UPI00163DB616|nr:hypothetical protein [Alkalicoccobacillus porphyridii]